ncbi:hypothetical protein, partial [Burkholderia ubonensis]|uniref:hypothetical protein n=1 Tax=Burkholderia ubonensis TaxID=101571 RepID=UPI001E28FD3B
RTFATPSGNAFREMCSFFTGTSSKFFIPRFYRHSLARQNPPERTIVALLREADLIVRITGKAVCVKSA